LWDETGLPEKSLVFFRGEETIGERKTGEMGSPSAIPYALSNDRRDITDISLPPHLEEDPPGRFQGCMHSPQERAMVPDPMEGGTRESEVELVFKREL
jgi:hypothetical protein